MKKLLLLLILPLVVMSCDLALLEEEANAYAAPNMGSPSDLPDTGARNYPTTKIEAMELYGATMSAVGAIVYENAVTRATVTETTDYTYSDFNTTVTGEIVDEYYVDDRVAVGYGDELSYNMNYLEPNSTYSPFMEMTSKGSIEATITNQTMYNRYSDYTLTINGKGSQKIDMKAGQKIVTSATEMTTWDMYYSANVALGYAISVVDNNGLGAKFILTMGVSLSERIDILSLGENEEIIKKTDSEFATLKVYNDNDELIGEYQIAFEDLV